MGLGYTPLYIASQNGHAGIVARLLASGADPRLETKGGRTPLFVARQYHQVYVMAELEQWEEKQKKGDGKERAQDA